MPNNLYIDPSITCTGTAFFIDGVLEDARLLRTKPTDTNRLLLLHNQARRWYGSETMDSVYYETPQLRARGQGAKPEDLFKLSMAVGAVVGALNAWMLEAVKITSWKGQLPKEITHEHMWRVLSEDEAATLNACLATEPKSLVHNAYDAVCIGLYIEGRATWVRRRKGRM
jgi:hypothetical protein